VIICVICGKHIPEIANQKSFSLFSLSLNYPITGKRPDMFYSNAGAYSFTVSGLNTKVLL
jgi:hypothetical protein